MKSGETNNQKFDDIVFCYIYSVTICKHCLHIVFVIGKRTEIFLGRGYFLGINFLREEFPIGMKISGVELSRKNFKREEFARIFIQKFFYLFYFVVGDPILPLVML